MCACAFVCLSFDSFFLFFFLIKTKTNPRKNTARRNINDYLRHILMTDLVNISHKEAQLPGQCSLQTLFWALHREWGCHGAKVHACSSVWQLVYMASLFTADSIPANTRFIVWVLNKASGPLAVLSRLQAWICILGTSKASSVKHFKSPAIFFSLYLLKKWMTVLVGKRLSVFPSPCPESQ